MYLYLLILFIISYFFGMIHGAKVVELISGVNLKNEGTKNYGASNATLVLGRKYGLIVLVVDIVKVIIVLISLKFYLNNFDLTNEIYYLYLYTAMVGLFIGHSFPLYMKFNGGKGTAVLLISILILNPLIGLIGILMFILIAYVSNYLVVGLFVFYLYHLGNAWYLSESINVLFLLILLFIIGVLLHIENIKRIKNKEEPFFRKTFNKK